MSGQRLSVTEDELQGTTSPDPAPRVQVVRRGRRLRVVAIALAVVLTPMGWSFGRALTAPGTDSVAARAAEWGRTHHAGSLITWLERLTYRPPKVGGRPSATSPLRALAAGPVAGHSSPIGRADVVPPATPALPGEGTWHVLADVNGRPALAAAYVRPDAVHTSYTAGLVWISGSQVRAAFHPGYQQPGGGPWREQPYLRGPDRIGLLAAFNSAFRLQDARGGFFADGRLVRALRPGAASLVVFRDGRMTVGAWNRDVAMAPDVAVVRQNLMLIVDHGRLAPGLADNVGGRWGYTLGNADYVWRSGLGVTAGGDLVYVSGNRLSATTLADLLRRAGAVRAMELDINPEWTSFILYRKPSGAPTQRNLLPDMQGSPRRYDEPSSRDFVALYAR
jgi:hypothetical protein